MLPTDADHALDPCLIEPIGRVRSPFQEKFGIPRQAGLVLEAEGWIELLPPYDDPQMVAGLEEFSHLWVVFRFHRCASQGWRRRVRPPRLGGNRSRGVLASRSPFRLNHLGLSAVELLGIDAGTGLRLHVRGLDMLDGTPVFDLKPYLPYTDAIAGARGGFADMPPEPSLRVGFAREAAAALSGRPELLALVRAVIELDPRPAYHGAEEAGRQYGMRLGNVEVKFQVEGADATVTQVLALPDSA